MLERHPPRYPGEPAILEVSDDGLIFWFERVADAVARLVHVETPGGYDLPARDYAVEARTDPAELMCDAGEIDGETLWKIDGMGYYDDMWF